MGRRPLYYIFQYYGGARFTSTDCTSSANRPKTGYSVGMYAILSGRGVDGDHDPGDSTSQLLPDLDFF
jgi:hypothetical protein